MKSIVDIDPRLTASEIVQIQMMNPDGTHTSIPFTRAEFDRLASEAAAANMEIAEYIKKTIMLTALADRAKVLRERAAFLRFYDGGGEQPLLALSDRLQKDPMTMRDALEAIAFGFGNFDNTETVMECADDVVAGDAFSLACQINYKVRVGATAARELLSLRERFRAAEAEVAQKTVALRALQRDATSERLEARLTEARVAERSAVAAELESLRAEAARQRSEIAELRASKKKLREALERAKEGR